MTMDYEQTRARLGELLDGELDDATREVVQAHVVQCATCRRELESLRSVTAQLASPPDVQVPPELWAAVEAQLDRARPLVSNRFLSLRWRPLASAAMVVLAVGLTWLLVSSLTPPTAHAHTLDFTPLLNRVGDDLEAGLRALLDVNGGRAATLTEATRTMKVRVHPPDELPGGLRLQSTHFVNMGDHESLAFFFSGDGGQMLVMQCPPGMRKEHGDRDCLPCRVGTRDAQVVREGPWHLVHLESENVCICVVSKLDELRELSEVLPALRIEY